MPVDIDEVPVDIEEVPVDIEHKAWVQEQEGIRRHL